MIDKTRYSAESKFGLRVLSFYTRLLPPDSKASVEPDLGGKLLYADELDDDGRALIAAANIAGAASLCATANALRQKQGVREGIVDFLVTSLDEALRILKNEIRKRAPVAVCVAAAPADVESQMAERGVKPDLLRPAEAVNGENTRPVPADVALMSWSVSSSPARWMPKLDAYALECAGELPEGTRRWLRLSPRYLGRLAQSIHLVLADRAFAARFMGGLTAWEDAGIPLKLQISYRGGCEEYNLPKWDKDESPAPGP
jgi:hypothetical protein